MLPCLADAPSEKNIYINIIFFPARGGNRVAGWHGQFGDGTSRKIIGPPIPPGSRKRRAKGVSPSPFCPEVKRVMQEAPHRCHGEATAEIFAS